MILREKRRVGEFRERRMRRVTDSLDDFGDDGAHGSFEEEHPESEKWTLLHEVQENYNQQKHGKARNSRKQRKKKKDFESRTPMIKRRNTLDAIIFNEMCDKADQDCENEAKEEAMKEGNRKSKRTLKLLRTNERDSKLEVGASDHYDIRHCCTLLKNIKIETKNRFRCLRSKPVDVGDKKGSTFSEQSTSISSSEQQGPSDCLSPQSQSLRDREIFHDTFSFLIRLGSTDKDRSCLRQISQEETRWQNELKDLIWLELQAYRADLSVVAMDEYLCKQREAVGALLDEIMAYRFDPIASLNKEKENENTSQVKLCIDAALCNGCLSMYCRDCTRAQSEALKQVENLLTRLESAEALFPSSQAFASQYPLYKSPEFLGRLKAMCLWYNMTKHHRLKLIILGKLLTLLHRNKKHDDSSLLDSGFGSRASDSTSPSDSNNSNTSSVSSNLPSGEFSLAQTWNLSPSETSFKCSEDEKLEHLAFYLTEFDRQVYRKYIEDVLKTRGLRKSLNFLERLHTSVLRKARLALEKSKILSEESTISQEEYEGDQELRRYGVWSPESRALNLPSYRAAFVFLSRVPLDVIHEFLRMRLEQKPEQPSPLSVRQLMRELREGLRIACIHRERFAEHSLTAAACDGPCTTLFDEDVREFDKNLKSVFNVYLDYLQQWVEMVHHDSFHKNLIQDEWIFVKSIAGKINHGYEIAGRKFCEIAKIMATQINEFFIERPRELREICSSRSNEEFSVKFHLISIGREWQTLFDEAREKVVKSVNLAKCLREDIQTFPNCKDLLLKPMNSLLESVMNLKHRITEVISEFQKDIQGIDETKSESEFISLRIRVREILHHAYRMGFEYYKELCKCVHADERNFVVKDLVAFAFFWMDFVKNYCERGRGLRPRWANQGLEFLMIVCEPINTKHLTSEEFEQLKTSMDQCISHVVGSASKRDTSLERDNFRKFSGSRATSPHCRSRASSIGSSHNSQNSLKTTESLTPKTLKHNFSTFLDEIDAVAYDVPEKNFSRPERIGLAVKNLENDIDQKLRSKELIGQVIDRKNVDKIKIKIRRVNFTWQRGIKIGQGRFGKVYTVVNNQTGELLAMKEVQLQPGDYRAIKRVTEELQIFEGIQHKHLVRYYGIEIHREEMLIFMEFCAEGTLESLIVGSGNGLPESLLRKYTHQLLLAVSVLHDHGIVHRDIKTANIFLTDERNCLKLGDFGSSVQIKAHTTMPGELQGFVGTQAYMAPEVFMKNDAGGHGRAADIWSIGCCVIEMASGKRPWAEYDSNYQIMFKVGNGESPQAPKHLSKEGIDFITKCLQHDPKRRPTASALMTHTFGRAYEDVNTDISTRPF